ncbi:PARP-domain-containing protein [Wilcoxina mikolae CBS 423.85]|nr:PARP-domain-containing protein [Wilcoxina mikolae CBS 423.85]
MAGQPFDGLVIAVSGTHKGYTQSAIERHVKKNGGLFTKTIEDNTTHLISNVVDVAKQSGKVKQAIENKLHIVSIDWLLTSVEKGAKQPESDHVINASVAPQSSGVKRAADTALPDTKDDEEPEPAAKKSKAVDGTARPKRGAKKVPEPVKDEEEEEEEEAKPKKTTRAKGKGKAKQNVKDEEEEEVKPKKTTLAKGKGKVKQNMKEEEKEEEEEEEEEEEKPVMKTVVKKGKAPVDEMSGLQKSHHVYVDSSGTAWDATLNQTNIGGNNNKFYQIQLLERDDKSSNGYSVFAHWGRVGERGQSQFKAQNDALSTAIAAFDKLMKAKSGQTWANRANALGGGNKYAYLERNYEDDDEDDTIKPLGNDGEEVKQAESKISKPLQDLMKLIFNTTFMEQSMASLSYDSKKLPLGKLSKTTILQGYEVLKKIGEVINDPTTVQTKYSEYGTNYRDVLNQLSSRYYTVIPHDFGRSAPRVIDSPQLLKKETELVENLVDMKISSEIIKDSTVNSSTINPIDTQYNSLGLNEAVALEKDSEEFQLLEAYVKKTHGKTHYIKLEVEEIFQVTRSVEEQRWQKAGWHKYGKDQRKLLWHGSRTTNFGGILSQGLRIAPPEAPVNGYMFDKGIYLADIVSKSANYCCASASGNTGLLLLCEAQLGNPMLELTNADYEAAKKCKASGLLATKGNGRTAPKEWEDAGIVNQNLSGVQMPKVSGKDKNITADVKMNACLQYNEYIVYDVSQVKIRYLFRCKFN